jgi:hypothetical protein
VALVRRGRVALAAVLSYGGDSQLQETPAAAGSWSGRPGPICARASGVYSGIGILVVEVMTWRGPGTTALLPAYFSTAAEASRAWPGLRGLVYSGCYVQPMTASRWRRWVPAAWLLKDHIEPHVWFW